jgi:threonyl-tRNA synthetase
MEYQITLKDGSIKQIEVGKTAFEFAGEISRSLQKNAAVAKWNEQFLDMSAEIPGSGTIEFFDASTSEGKHALRHTSSHIMAQAIQRLFPDVKFGIGPAIDNGFYYDMDSEHIFTPEDLEKIQTEMEKIVKEDLPLKKSVVSRQEALALFAEKGESYKVELITDLPEDVEISLYQQGEFVDLCAGPHMMSTGKVKAIKLLSIAGAYWRGNEKNKMLQRIYGTSFEKKADLDTYLHLLEEAAKRDHRKLGKELGLFALLEEGPGFPFFLPKGMALRNELEKFWREIHRKYEYEEIRTPIILNEDLWHRSGHWDHYRENMYFTKIDEEDYAIKPMNCPGSILVYKTHFHSYREFPIRWAELGLVHRHELSGALHGLMRVRAFTQDDAHIFMLPEQIKDEIQTTIGLFDEVYSAFGLSYHVELSTRPEKSMGSDEVWEMTTSALKAAMDERGIDYRVNEGDGAFYGPKIDFHLTDSIGRTWQCGTIQLDMQMPERFDMDYIGEDGQKHRPVMIHRVVYGSMERFIGILIEHFAGAFPLWLAPVQLRVLTITDRHKECANKLVRELKALGLRVELDDRNEKMGYKIRQGQVEKVPYLLVIGDKEMESQSISVRKYGGEDLGSKLISEFITEIQEEIVKRK